MTTFETALRECVAVNGPLGTPGGARSVEMSLAYNPIVYGSDEQLDLAMAEKIARDVFGPAFQRIERSWDGVGFIVWHLCELGPSASL